ncbi:hypothetical protein PspKH34_00360 [Parageobacillus sp. KH3-4]|jgi:hypothetical protein|nr:hypothetical protein PspKH34_00360 [Parageobacillus sp. KH3-4]
MKKDFSTYLDEKSQKKFQSFLKEIKVKTFQQLFYWKGGSAEIGKKAYSLGNEWTISAY